MKKGLILVAVLAVTLGITTAASGKVQALITGAGIKDGSVESVDIEDRTILPKDLSARAVAALEGERGPRGSRVLADWREHRAPGRRGWLERCNGPAGFDRRDRCHGAEGRSRGSGRARSGSVATDRRRSGRAAAGSTRPTTGTPGLDDRRSNRATGSTGSDRDRRDAGSTARLGPAGPTGPAGPAGADGADGGSRGLEIVTGPLTAIAAEDYGFPGAACPAGKVAISGQIVSQSGAIYLVESFQFENAGIFGWRFAVFNLATDRTEDVVVKATCTAFPRDARRGEQRRRSTRADIS